MRLSERFRIDFLLREDGRRVGRHPVAAPQVPALNAVGRSFINAYINTLDKAIVVRTLRLDEFQQVALPLAGTASGSTAGSTAGTDAAAVPGSRIHWRLRAEWGLRPRKQLHRPAPFCDHKPERLLCRVRRC